MRFVPHAGHEGCGERQEHDGQGPEHEQPRHEPVLGHDGAHQPVLGRPQAPDDQEAQQERADVDLVLPQQLGHRVVAVQLGHQVHQRQHQQGDRDRGHRVDEGEQPLQVPAALPRTPASVTPSGYAATRPSTPVQRAAAGAMFWLCRNRLPGS